MSINLIFILNCDSFNSKYILTGSQVLIGKCSVKTQGKILIQLDGINLPKIGSKAFIKKNGKHKIIGEVIEAIGSTQSPWIVISANKLIIQEVQINEEIYAQQIPKTKKGQKAKRRRKHSKKQKI